MCCHAQLGYMSAHLLGIVYGLVLHNDSERWRLLERLVCLPSPTLKSWIEGQMNPVGRHLTRTLLVEASLQLEALGVFQGTAGTRLVSVVCTMHLILHPSSSAAVVVRSAAQATALDTWGL
jgi:hypothetical protein